MGYEDYITKQPMRDGEEMRNFFDDLDAEKEMKDVFVIETNYRYGWETEDSYDTREEAKRDFPDYTMMVKSYGGNTRIRKVRERR